MRVEKVTHVNFKARLLLLGLVYSTHYMSVVSNFHSAEICRLPLFPVTWSALSLSRKTCGWWIPQALHLWPFAAQQSPGNCIQRYFPASQEQLLATQRAFQACSHLASHAPGKLKASIVGTVQVSHWFLLQWWKQQFQPCSAICNLQWTWHFFFFFKWNRLIGSASVQRGGECVCLYTCVLKNKSQSLKRSKWILSCPLRNNRRRLGASPFIPTVVFGGDEGMCTQ